MSPDGLLVLDWVGPPKLLHCVDSLCQIADAGDAADIHISSTYKVKDSTAAALPRQSDRWRQA